MKTDNPLPIFFESRQARVVLVVATFALALIIVAMVLIGKANDVSIVGTYAILFPTGLLWLMPVLVTIVTKSPSHEGGGIGDMFLLLGYSFLGWILYLGLALFIVRATKLRTALILYLLLIFLLVANVAGCSFSFP
jgi:hypothetical protein